MPNTPTNPAQPAGGADLAGLLTVMQLSDSALPTGSFSHSFGMETYLQQGLVDSAESYTAWVTGYLHQMAYTEGLATRLAHEAALEGNNDRILRIDQLLYAAAIPHQVRDAGTSMGERMNQIVEVATEGSEVLQEYRAAIKEGTAFGHPSVVFALAAAETGVSARHTVAAYLMQLGTSLTQNAIRAIPLGQNAGQRVLGTLRESIPAVVDLVFRLDDYDLGASAPGLEIAQMVHETQRARMFMS